MDTGPCAEAQTRLAFSSPPPFFVLRLLSGDLPATAHRSTLPSSATARRSHRLLRPLLAAALSLSPPPGSWAREGKMWVGPARGWLQESDVEHIEDGLIHLSPNFTPAVRCGWARRGVGLQAKSLTWNISKTA